MATSPLRHGEAVALGLIAAASAAVVAGLCEPTLGTDVTALAEAVGLPTLTKGLPGDDALIDQMMGDKKVEGQSLRLVVPVFGKRARVMRDPTTPLLRAAWKAVRAK